ncbi:hypothetical protein BH09ACT4_BH09ACT4_24740 [soil metagenome]
MPDIDDFFPPLGYDWWWWLVLPVFVALLVLWIVLSKRFARMPGWRRRGTGTVSGPKVLPLPVDVRRKALARIASVEQRVNAGALSPRDAHIELSGILRELAFYTTRFDARKMTLTDLRRAGLTRLADTIAGFYPVNFAPAEAIEAQPAVDAARMAVSQWS